MRGYVFFVFLVCPVTPHEKFVWTAAERTYVESLPASSAKTKRLATVQKKLDELQRKAVTDHSPSADDAFLKAQLCKVMQMHWKATLQVAAEKCLCFQQKSRTGKTIQFDVSAVHNAEAYDMRVFVSQWA